MNRICSYLSFIEHYYLRFTVTFAERRWAEIFSLWGMKPKTIIIPNLIKKPSPTNPNPIPGSAQNPEKISDGSICQRTLKYSSIERISLPAFLTKRIDAGMTVEAAVVLPLMLYFLLNLSCAIELIRLHGNLQLALWEVGSRLAVYGYALEDSDAASLFTGFYIQDQVIAYTGKEYLNSSPIKSGSQGISMWESNIFSSEDELDVIVTYSVAPWSGLAAFSSFRMANRYYAHIWSGYEIPDNAEQSEQELDIVYITENGQVYHENRNCTYLVLSVREVSRLVAETAVNQWGKKYSPCEKCKPESTCLTLYITEEGERYHSDRNCSGLKRTVFSVPRSSVSGYRACSRCG